MWQTGKACESGSDCTTYDNSSCDDGLCVKDGKVGGEGQGEGKTSEATPTPTTPTAPTTTTTPTAPTTTTTPTTPTTPATPVTPSNTSASVIQCPDIGAMTPEAREAVVAMHNKLRSSLARGLEKDGLGGNAPKASKMLKMVYDCEVEASAMKNAQQCIFEHSESKFGENLFMTSELNADKVAAVKEMAWETSYKLGCAVQHCDDMTYVVCQYSPAGNALNRLIYTPGEPCQTDDGCPGSYTCSKEEGLCNVV
ncbi:SCP-like protein [Oesophagostomum dentatum]|uniref:SCP-like protein n=1 Tax=Oesophagostomum dentatum TaxID=61180 RepID=A0A0B1TBF2_OESDE|nr:SCP-like protein [Oesophagostomum dentatum]